MIGIDTIGSLLSIGAKVIDRLFPDPEQKAKAQLELLKLQQDGELKALSADLEIALAQAATNTAEAQSGNAFAAGWRPLVGYVCAAALAYNFVAYPLLAWSQAFWPDLRIPPQFTGGLFELVLGMLGLGGFRTFEKLKGVSR